MSFLKQGSLRFLNRLYPGFASILLAMMSVASAQAAPAHLINLSARAPIQGGAYDIIAGFGISGTGTQRLILRGIQVGVGVDPKLTLRTFEGDFLDENDNWQQGPRAHEISQLPSHLQPTTLNDAALLVDLAPNYYTVTLGSVGATGLGLVGIDAIETNNTTTEIELINISARALVQGGDKDIIGGFGIAGTGKKRLILRGIVVENVDPIIVLKTFHGQLLNENDQWQNSSRVNEIKQLPEHLQPTSINDAGLLVDLAAEYYTVTLSSGNGEGIGLVGIDATGEMIDESVPVVPPPEEEKPVEKPIEKPPVSDSSPEPAPPIDSTVVSRLADTTQFLYTGANPNQTGVEPNTIDAKRVALLRGKVITRDGQALSGVTITINNHSEFGQTLTGQDGWFNLVVNGGGTLTINYHKDGYLPGQRKVQSAWQAYLMAEDIVMLPVDSVVTAIDLNQPVPQIAQGQVVVDDDGQRQASVLFPVGTTATMTLPDGTTQPLAQLNVRATEYTVGENGPQTMPAPLPPASGYTYAVELSVDQAMAAGATRVDFDQPLSLFVDNFLGFPTGSIVPVGWYDRTKAAWIPSKNGRVVEIISINNGLALLDVAGNGQAADAQTLNELGITQTDQQQLATLYQPGKSLWWSPIRHFTPWDCNWPYGPPTDAKSPGEPVNEGEQPMGQPKTPDEDNPDDPCEQQGCLIEAETQVLGESIPIIGTSFNLNYRSNRVPGRKTAYTLNIPLRGDSMPASAKRIHLEVQIAGQTFTENFPIETKATTFEWNGQDAFGRDLQGQQAAKIKIGYEYDAVYYAARADFEQSFGRFGDTPISGNRTRQEVVLWKEYTKMLGTWYPESGLGGFTLDIHHAYDPNGQILHLGNGRQRRADKSSYGDIIETIAGNGRSGFHGDGGPAKEAEIPIPHSVVVSPDGGLYIASVDRIRHIDTNGIINTIAGNGDRKYKFKDGVPATETSLYDPQDIALDADGKLYIADTYHHRIRHVNSYGIISTVAGNGQYGNEPFNEYSNLATTVSLSSPSSIAFGPDNNLYIADETYIHRVDHNNIINTIVDISYLSPYYDIDSIAFGLNGDLYFAANYSGRSGYVNYIAKYSKGKMTIMAGKIGGTQKDNELAIETYLPKITDITIDSSGNLYIATYAFALGRYYNSSVRRVSSDGIINTIVGSNGYGFSGDNGLAKLARLSVPSDITFGPNDSLYIADSSVNRIRRVRSAFGGSSFGMIFIASEDGGQYYEFDASGRHQRTLDTFTGQAIYTFTYNESGYLVGIEDLDGNLTTIERNSDNQPLAIIVPYGQRSELTLENGYLASVTRPDNQSHQMVYSEGGLLKQYTNPRGHVAFYQYDELGKLIEDINPAKGGWTLKREEKDHGYLVTMTSKAGRASHFEVKSLPDGTRERINTAPDGTRVKSVIDTNGTTTVTHANGTVVVQTEKPDPRFGMQSPISENTVTTPSGLSASTTSERSVELADNNNPLSLKTLTHQATVNDRTSTSVYDATHKTVTTTSAAGRQSLTYFDDKGKVIKQEIAGLAAVNYRYDGRGRLETITAGTGEKARITAFQYDANGYLANISDALARQVSFAYDSVGQVTQQTLPDQRVIRYGYDANGNVTSITPPSRPNHDFTYNAVDLPSQYTPPAIGLSTPETQYEYNLDKQLTKLVRPDGQTIALNYGTTTGRLESITLPAGQQRYTYNATTGQLTTITTIDNGTLSYSYDGSLPLTETWGNGLINGTVARTYDNNFQVAELRINESNSINYQYDSDNLLTQAGHLTLAHHPQHGLLTHTALGQLETERTYNEFGELINETATYNGNALHQATYHYDKLGRITEKTETIENIKHVYGYAYDLAGRLTQVITYGIIAEQYQYDSNGNRLHATTVNGTVEGNYDQQDRLLQYGDNRYEYTANGELIRKTNNGEVTEYTYDLLGNLRQIQLPDKTIEYMIDGRNRRIGKKVNGILTQGFLYQDSLNPIAELDNQGKVATLFVYGAKTNIPDYLIKDNKTYRILSDHLGSPRLIIDINDGTIAQQIDYDTFGKVIFDSNPGFQPFGFAGGIYDADTGLVRFGARDYDAEIGRWTAKDPILFEGGDTNLYGYVVNDPVNFVDPLGKKLECIYAVTEGIMSCYDNNESIYLSTGWVAGMGECQNNPACEDKQDIGPIPAGNYTSTGIPSHRDSSTTRRSLTPDPNNQMYGRDTFQTHYCPDTETCSNGCPSHPNRTFIGHFNEMLDANPNTSVTIIHSLREIE